MLTLYVAGVVLFGRLSDRVRSRWADRDDRGSEAIQVIIIAAVVAGIAIAVGAAIKVFVDGYIAKLK